MEEKKDEQQLLFDHYRIDVSVSNGKVTYSLNERPKKTTRSPKKTKRSDEAA